VQERYGTGRGRVRLGATLVFLSAFGFCKGASAEAAPDHFRSNAYYGVQAGVIAALFGGSIGLNMLRGDERGPDPCWFPGDAGLRGRSSAAAARTSDSLIAITVAAPAAAALGKGVSPRLLNTSIVYTETLGANLLLNSLSKVLFRRPRPYTYRFPAGTPPEDDWYVSFYSGHSSMSFAAATSGSYLFAESAPDRHSRWMMWGAEFTLASATALLRVRAGKHYYSDILVGALMGIGIGIGVPVANGARYRPRPEELAAAGGGLLLGSVTALLLPFSQDDPLAESPVAAFTVAPMMLGERGVGLGASGSF